tara:strand:- start:3102 stop:4103 length:1002 start_codon:yes stop_codon:yes gene_type:complete
MENKTIAFFGCKDTTRFLIENLNHLINISQIITVSPNKNLKINIPDYSDLKKIFGSKIKTYQVNRYDLNDNDDIKTILNYQIDIAFCVGWQRLIPEKILKNVKIGVFGMHGSSQNLPKGRGRSPMNWSIIEDRKTFYTNLFKYESGVDNGKILDTIKFSITNKDNATTMHFKNMLAMKEIIIKQIDSLLRGDYVLKPQKKIKPSYYPKRNPDDSQIDWKMSINDIDRFIRAVSKPFNGSFTFLEDEKLIIYEAQIFDDYQFKYNKRINGEIVEVLNHDMFLIKCKDGTLLVKSYKYEKEIIKNSVLKTNYKTLKVFEKNKKGYYDLNKIEDGK